MPFPKVRLLPVLSKLSTYALSKRGFTRKTIEANLGTISYFEGVGTGSLPPLVLFHGIAATADGFARVLIPLLRSFSRVIAIDFPGHGHSPSPKTPLSPRGLFEGMVDALDAIATKELGDKRFILAGHSLGGATAAHYTLRRPDRVAGLALIAPAGARIPDEELAATLKSFSIKNRHEARDFISRVYARRPWFSALLTGDLIDLTTNPTVRYLIETAKNDDSVPDIEFRQLKMPVFLYWGERERLLPRSARDFWVAAMPAGADVFESKVSAHCPHLDEPGVLVQRLVDFGKRVASIA